MDSFQQQVRERNGRELQDWAGRALRQENEAKRREHDDRLKKLTVST